MKHAINSSARNCQDRSHKNCVCGSHSQKARKPRRREKQSKETAEKRRLAFRAVFESGLALAQQSVLLVMIDHLPDCRPSAARIAARAKVSEREVFRVFKELEAVGVVEVLRSPGRPSSYRIDLEKLPSQENTPDARSPLTYGHNTPDAGSWDP